MKNNEIILLSIESSCDDTSAAIIKNGKCLSNIISTQQMHAAYGGVVPEVASRSHLVQILPVVKKALVEAKISLEDVDAIAFTKGPGLLGALHVGVSFAKGLALVLDKPLIEVHHIQAHVLAHFLEDKTPSFPFLCLTVSGGHTQILLVKQPLEMEVIGSTIDVAAGEAFDKIGKLLGLGYPAGPEMDRRAALGEVKFFFTEPKIDSFNFSFSGLKTNVLRFLEKELKHNPAFISENLNDLCASIQARIVSILLHKIEAASKFYKIKEVAISGGVSANSGLRAAISANQHKKNWNVYIPKMSYCTDNAAMIGIVGHYKYIAKEFCDMTTQAEAKA